MNIDILAGNWMKLSGILKQGWGLVIDDNMTRLVGRRSVLEGRMREISGYSKLRDDSDIYINIDF
jgi:uncharacterized protein YjbJ (UPF0337 family)